MHINRPFVRRTQRCALMQPPLCQTSDRPSCLCLLADQLQPLTWQMCWRTALYLRTTSRLQASVWPLIRTGCWVEKKTTSGASPGHENTMYSSLYLTKPSALGQHLFATHTCTLALCLRPFLRPSYTLMHARRDKWKNKTDMLLRLNSPWPFQRISEKRFFICF